MKINTAEEMRKIAENKIAMNDAAKAEIVNDMCKIIQDKMMKSAMSSPEKGYITFNPAQDEEFHRMTMEIYNLVYAEFKKLGYDVQSKGDRGISGRQSSPANMSIVIKWGK